MAANEKNSEFPTSGFYSGRSPCGPPGAVRSRSSTPNSFRSGEAAIQSPAPESVRRRRAHLFALGIVAIALIAISHAPLHAQIGNTTCATDPATGVQDCVTTVNLQQFAQIAYETQQATEWCWAASISMIWAFYRHPVAQAEVVTGTFGQLLNQGGQPSQIFQALNGQRVDDNGAAFTSTSHGLVRRNVWL
jgi:hypothetical protein